MLYLVHTKRRVEGKRPLRLTLIPLPIRLLMGLGGRTIWVAPHASARCWYFRHEVSKTHQSNLAPNMALVSRLSIPSLSGPRFWGAKASTGRAVSPGVICYIFQCNIFRHARFIVRGARVHMHVCYTMHICCTHAWLLPSGIVDREDHLASVVALGT